MLTRLIVLVLLFPMMALAANVQPLDKVVAVVNDGVVTQSELDAQLVMVKQQIIAKNMKVPPADVLKKQVLQQLINVKLELQLAKQNNISVDATELNNGIEKIAKTNHLSVSELREAITHQGINWEAYRKSIRKEMIISRIQQNAISNELVVSKEQVDNYLKTMKPEVNQTNYTYHVQTIVIPLSEEPTTTELTKAQDKAKQLLVKIRKGADFSQVAMEESSGELALEGGDLGERHLAELPEIFAKRVVNMKAGETAGPIRTGNGFQLIKVVAVNGASMHHDIVKTHVRHILIKANVGTMPAEAQREVNNIYQQIKAGKPFAAMAKQYSLDAASAVNGGDLGWVSPGELVPEFETAMDALPLNSVSKPVKSAFGWHLIEVLGRKKEDDTAQFKRQQVQAFLQQRKFSEAVENWHQHLRTDSYVKIMDKKLA